MRIRLKRKWGDYDVGAILTPPDWLAHRLIGQNIAVKAYVEPKPIETAEAPAPAAAETATTRTRKPSPKKARKRS